MKKHIPSFTDISNWQLQIHLNTGGSRSKKIATHPETNDEYFYKGSKQLPNGEIRYPTEFWSEIAASKIGQYLGFTILDYNIAYRKTDKQPIGCLSKSMICYSENRLTEGKNYLTGYDAYYNPEKDKGKYTFQLICRALKNFELNQYIPYFLELLVFDAVVSNSDRHQENWAFITNFKDTVDDYNYQLNNPQTGWWTKKAIRSVLFLFKNPHVQISFEKYKFFSKRFMHINSKLAINEFSPIYDSGCCLGREKSESEIEEFLRDSQKLERYVQKGMAEVRWEGEEKKLNHFDLLRKLQIEHAPIIEQTIQRVIQRYNPAELRQIIEQLDKNLPESLHEYKLSKLRKELMIKLIHLRIEKLKELL